MTASAAITGRWPCCPECRGSQAMGRWQPDPEGEPIPLGLVVDRADEGVMAVWVCEWCEYETPADVGWAP